MKIHSSRLIKQKQHGRPFQLSFRVTASEGNQSILLVTVNASVPKATS